LRKIYKDLYKYTNDIISKCVEIEDNPNGMSDEAIVNNKFTGAASYREDDTTTVYTMSDVFSLMSVTERNLYELASDIATFSELIGNAKAKESRGFSVGNMILNLKEQQSSLTLGFRSNTMRLEQFLQENLKFSGKCVKRIELISNEITSEEDNMPQDDAEEPPIDAENNETPPPVIDDEANVNPPVPEDDTQA
jgi:hypothetical protein